jgi:hypothetical protein
VYYHEKPQKKIQRGGLRGSLKGKLQFLTKRRKMRKNGRNAVF